MRKNTLFSVLFLLMGWVNAWAQSSWLRAAEAESAITNVGAKLTDVTKLTEGQDYLIKGVGGRSGWAFAGETNAKMYLGSATTEATALTERYIFHIVKTSDGFYLQSFDGKYVNVPNLIDATDNATVFNLTAKPNAEAGIWNLKTPGSYLNMNPANEEEAGASWVITQWNDAGDPNGKWEIYPVNITLPKYTISYNIRDAIGNMIASESHLVFEGDPFPALANAASASMFFNNIPTGTVTVSGTYDVSIANNLPFETSTINGSFSADNHWYTMTVQRNPNKQSTYNATSGKVDNSTTIAEANVNNVFAFTGDAYHGFKIYNGAAGAKKQLFVNDVNNEICVFAETGATFGLYKNTESGYQFKLKGSATTHINDVSNQLGVWAAGGSATDAGGTFTFAEADIDPNPLNNLRTLVNTVEASCGVDPGYIALTESVTSAIATAKALVESESSDMEQIDASIAALTAILSSSPRVTPEADKLYMIVCAYPGYEAQQGVKKAMYSNGTQLMWGTLNEQDRTQYWRIAPMDGGYSIQNYSDEKYAGNFAMGETAVAATLAQLSVIGQFNININGQTAHTNGHSSGAGVSGNIVAYGGGANTASSWYIKEVEEPAGEILTGVTINYTVNGTIMKTVTDATFDTNNPTAPVDFVTVGNPTIDREATPITITLPCTYDLPFTASASYETATWYAMDMHSNDSGTGDVYNGTNRYIWTFVAENEDVQLPKVASTEVDAGYIPDNRKWAFVGDPFNGFKIYNKAAGSTLTLRKAEDGNNAAVMSATDDRNVFMLHHTSENIENSFAWKIEGDSYYINTQAVNEVKVLRGWTAADGGSSCRVFASLTDIPTGTFYRFKGVANERYLTTGNIGSRMPMVEEGTGAESIFYFDNERKLWNYASGLSTKITSETAGVNDAANTWEIMDNGNGQYILKANAVDKNGRYLYNHNTSDAANVGLANRNSILAGNNTLWVIEPVTELPVSVSAAGYATLFAPKALNIPTDMEAYSGAVNTEKSALEMTAVEGIIPANTPVVLKAAAGNYTFTIATEEGTAVESNDLLGVVRRTATPADTYTLQNQNGNVGFYPYNGENINGFKAYITLPADAAVNGLSFSFGDATGIESISAAEADNSKSTEIYDLAGRRVSKPVKGLYIIGGKKVIVK
ncbi:MAG: hypothetical protein J6B92_04995 [Paraprevotella sp.]|nr:hypothetical protein [Paraprevotella sp.]